MKTKVLVTYTATHTAEVEIEHEPGEDPVKLAVSGDCEEVTHRKLHTLDENGWDWDVEAEALP